MTVVIVNLAAPPPGDRMLVPERVRRVVAALADRLGPALEITQAEVAQAAGCSREEASRELARLERAGFTTQGRGRIVVHDVEALRTGQAAKPDPQEDCHNRTVTTNPAEGGSS